MPTTGSVSRWIRRLEARDAAALQGLWEKYFEQLVRVARQQLAGSKGLGADEEDVALSAFKSFFLAAGRGKFPKLSDRDDLWQILVMLTRRKIVNLLKHERARKRGGGQARWTLDDFAELVHHAPRPDFAAQLAEEYRRLLDRLADPALQEIAIWKMEGRTNKEIAERLDRTVATVERRLRLIRTIWQEKLL
jgi:RNA polymerase sigma factor (sigma-70 family)